MRAKIRSGVNAPETGGFADRRKLFNEDGSPKHLRCYEAKRNPTIDRFTIVFSRASSFGGKAYVGKTYYVGASANPSCFYQHGEAWRWEFSASGSRVAFSSLPPRLRDAVLAEYRELWGIA